MEQVKPKDLIVVCLEDHSIYKCQKVWAANGNPSVWLYGSLGSPSRPAEGPSAFGPQMKGDTLIK